MMNRLRDDTGENPVAAKGIEMLRGTPPAPRMTDLKRRVWMSLQQTDDRVAAASWMPSAFTPGRMRAFALVATIVCLAGSAGAVIVGRWIAVDRSPSASPSLRRVELKAKKRQTTAKQVVGKQEVAEPAIGEPALQPSTTPATPLASPPAFGLSAPSERKVPLFARPSVSAKASNVRSSPVTVAPDRAAAPALPGPTLPTGALAALPLTGSVDAPASARERTEVLDAMIALRRNHDPGRAGVLLDRYLVAHPRGVLHEEALALAIEAADGRDDRAAARSLARTYESRYPQGRFVRFARSHTEPLPPTK